MLTQKDYCDYETCVALKELGYPRYHYDNGGELDKILRMVTLYNAQKWLRGNCNLHIEVRWFSNMWYEYEVKEAEGKVVAEGCAFPTYEEALSTAVRMAVEYLKEE